MRKSVSLVVFALVLCMASFGTAQFRDYRNDSLGVTEFVKQFVVEHHIYGSRMDIVHKIIELIHNDLYFIRIDRRRIESWVMSPEEATRFRIQISWLESALDQLNRIRMFWPLSQLKAAERENLEKYIYYSNHDLFVFDNVFIQKNINSRDVPFSVSGSEAVEYGISDGCTTATKAFIVLAKAAGISEVRFVCTGCTSDYNVACPVQGDIRRGNITINGHFFALVKLDEHWALVNCTYFNPYSPDSSGRYEIFHSLEGQDISPDTLKLRLLRIPSFQKEGICQNQLYVIAVGSNSEDDLDIENYDALMNLSVSGDRNCSSCGYMKF